MLRRSLPFALVALVALAGCDTNDSGDADAPAVLTPAAFTFDRSFPEDDNAHIGQNFVEGAARVFFVSAAVGVHLVIPAAATDAATQVEPRVEHGTWIWENTVDHNGNDITFRLEGTPEGTQVDWRMLISADAPIDGQHYDDFVLYTARTSLNGRTGEWHLFYKISGTSTNVLDADFEVRGENNGEITFSVPETNPDPGARGASIEYGALGSARSFLWTEQEPSHTHLVEWDEQTHAGAITAWNYNGGVRACWDSSLNDVACR